MGGPFDGIASTTPAPAGWFPAAYSAAGHNRPGCRVGRRAFAAARDQERDAEELQARSDDERGAVAVHVRGPPENRVGSPHRRSTISESNESTVARCRDGIIPFR